VLSEKADSLDSFTRDIRQLLSDMNEKFSTKINGIKSDFEDTM
jgi:hypothetical protein